MPERHDEIIVADIRRLGFLHLGFPSDCLL